MQYENGPAAPVRYDTFTQYRREVAASSVSFRPLIERSCGPLSLYHPPLSSQSSLLRPIPSSVRHPIPIQKVDSTLVTPPCLRVSTSGGDHLPSCASLVCPP
ncbi:hypothetical protein EVAR_69682_1 [Eumeta japonica]|uniref:Uncharacterized protein n=1 Tax=Eumeta variegata TaxID=151549 RepID=A0A4C1SR23_EUMVA|nr:hypothetical protein EVAR_69682_1 [Eumeta japonica]